MSERARILVVEDDPSISFGLRLNLEADGYEVAIAEDGASGLERAREGWDLIILDVMLPRIDGFEVVRRLSSERNIAPVLMLSARGAEVDKVTGLELGAVDYVTKPFGLAELLARIRVALRRRERQPESAWCFGTIRVDPSSRGVTRAGQPIDLTPTEFEVLSLLARADGRVLSRRQILDAVWGQAHHGTERTVDNFMAQLRAKLEDDPSLPRHLLTVRGVGYRFDP